MMHDQPTIILRHGDEVACKNPEIEWYAGKELYTHPIRVKVKDVWEQVFSFEKRIEEDSHQRRREIIFRCHIGDNRIIEVVLSYGLKHKEG